MSSDQIEKKIEQIESDLKMLKNEIKLGVMSVHDYLINMKTSPMDDSKINLGPDEETLMNLGGGLDMGEKKEIAPAIPAFKSSNENEKLKQTPQQDSLKAQPPKNKTEQPSADSSIQRKASPDLARTEPNQGLDPFNYPQEQQMQREKAPYLPQNPAPAVFASQDIQVNAVANLIGWVSAVKQRLSPDKLPIILEVYGICNELPPKTKKLILRLADLVAEQPKIESGPEVWSQLLLQLHGILMGNFSTGTGEQKQNTSEERAVPEKDESKLNDMPFKLKLVLPVGDDDTRELNIGEFRSRK